MSFTQSVQTLGESLGYHNMRHEENEALPLVETFLGPEGWAAFGRAIRKTQGLRPRGVPVVGAGRRADRNASQVPRTATSTGQ